MIADSLNDFWIIEQQRRFIPALGKFTQETPFLICRVKQLCGETVNLLFHVLQVDLLALAENGKQRLANRGICDSADAVEANLVLKRSRAAHGTVEENAFTEQVHFAFIKNSLAEHIVDIIEISGGSSFRQRLDLAAEQFDRRQSVDLKMGFQNIRIYGGLANRKYMLPHGIVDLDFDVIRIPAGVPIIEHS